MVYADNAATTEIDIEAYEVMKKYLIDAYGNPSQPYSFSRETKKAICDARETIANCIGANSNEVFFTSGGTESDNWAIKGFSRKQKKKSILVSSIEHHAVLKSAESLKREGYDIIPLKVTDTGIVQPCFLRESINNEVGLVSVMLANNEIGSIQPIRELTKIAHEYGAVFHTDAVQAVGHIAINVNELCVDMLSASAHKFHGPRGVGFLYIREGVDLYPFMDGGAQEKGFRAGTENVPAIVGMAHALKNCCSVIDSEKERLEGLESDLIHELEANRIDFLRNGAKNHLPGIINLSFKNSDGERILHRLDLMGICISTGSACDSVNTRISHVVEAIGVPKEYARGTVRISLGRNNTADDIRAIANALIKVLKNSD